MQLIRVSVLTRILKTEVIESIPGKKLGVKTENVEFDPENLAASAEILFFFMNYFKILVRTLTLHRCVIPTMNQDVSIFIKKIK